MQLAGMWSRNQQEQESESMVLVWNLDLGSPQQALGERGRP